VRKRGTGSIDFGSSIFCVKSNAAFSLAFGIERAQAPSMTTVTKLATVAMSIAICASAFAAPSKSVATSKQTPVKAKRCVALITGSAVRQDCARLGVIPTTAYQLDRIGGHSATND
jgi:hypothetical protein